MTAFTAEMLQAMLQQGEVQFDAHTYVYHRQGSEDWTPDHDEVLVAEGYLIRHSCKKNDIWTKSGAPDHKCSGCGRLVQPGVLLRIQLKPEQEAAMREVLHVR